MTESVAQPNEEQVRDAPRPVRRRVNLPRGQMPHDPGAWFGLGDFVKLLRTAFIRNADAEGEASDPVPQAVDPSAKKQRVPEPTEAERDLEARLLRRRQRQQEQFARERRFREEREKAWREKHGIAAEVQEAREGQAVVFGRAVRGRVNFPKGQLPALERVQRKGAVVSASLHLVLILIIVLAPVVVRRVMGDPGEPGGGGGGGGGREIQFIQLPPAAASAPAPAEEAVQASVPPPEPVEDDIFTTLPTPDVVETDAAAVDAETQPEISLESLGLGLGLGTGDGPGEGTGTGGGVGSGEGEGIGSGIGDGTGGDNGDARAPEPRAVIYPFETPPDDIRGVELMLHFWVDRRGRVTKVEITPHIKDSDFRNKLMDRVKAWVFYPARTMNGSPVEGEYFVTVTF